AAAAVTEVLRQFAQRPVRAGRDLDIKVGGGRDRSAERGRAVFDQPQDLGELQDVLHGGCVSQRSGRRVANLSDERVDGRAERISTRTFLYTGSCQPVPRRTATRLHTTNPLWVPSETSRFRKPRS